MKTVPDFGISQKGPLDPFTAALITCSKLQDILPCGAVNLQSRHEQYEPSATGEQIPLNILWLHCETVLGTAQPIFFSWCSWKQVSNCTHLALNSSALHGHVKECEQSVVIEVNSQFFFMKWMRTCLWKITATRVYWNYKPFSNWKICPIGEQALMGSSKKHKTGRATGTIHKALFVH